MRAKQGRHERKVSDSLEQPTVAIAHDYLTQRGGAERVVLALHRALPDATVHTSLFQPSETYPEFGGMDVRVSALNRVGPLRHHHRLAFPLLAPTFSNLKVDADVVVCSTSGWAHGIHTDGSKIAYCHAPARWLYQCDRYVEGLGRSSAWALRALYPSLMRWDRHAASTVSRYVANSSRSRDMIRSAYGIDATVLHPPCSIDSSAVQTAPDESIEPGYFLIVSRLLPYKNVGAAVAAFSELSDQRLVVVGTGPIESQLRESASANVTFLPVVRDDQLRWLYANSRALIGASYEDFGLTPIEAAAFGVPSITLRFGGYLDTVVEGETGLFFDQPDPESIVRAVRAFDRWEYDPEAIASKAAMFSEDAFRTELLDIIQSVS